MENINKDIDIIEEAILDAKRLTKLAEEAGKEFSAQNLKKEAEKLVAETLMDEEEDEIVSEEEIEKIFAEMESDSELDMLQEQETAEDVLEIVKDLENFAKSKQDDIDADSFEAIEELNDLMIKGDIGEPLRPIVELKNISSLIKRGLQSGKSLIEIGREYSKKDGLQPVEAVKELFSPFLNIDLKPEVAPESATEPEVKQRNTSFLGKVKGIFKSMVSEEDEIDALLNDLEGMNEGDEEMVQETDEALLRKIEASLKDSERRLLEMKKVQEAIQALKSDDIEEAKKAVEFIRSLPPIKETDEKMTKEEALAKAKEYVVQLRRDMEKLESEFNKTKGEALKAANDMNEEEMLDEYSVEELDEMLKELQESEHLDEADLAAKQKEMEDKIKKNHEEAKQRLANMEKMVNAVKSMKEEEMPFGESEDFEMSEEYMKEVEDAMAEFESMEESLAHTQTHANAKKAGSHLHTNYGKEERLRPAMKEAKLAKMNGELKKSLQESNHLNQKYAKALELMRAKINEMASYTANLVNINKLFMEASTTKDEKLEIAERFRTAKTVEQSKALYESIKRELSSSNVKYSVDKKVSTKVTVSNNGTVLKESNASVNVKNRFMELVNYNPQN